MKSLSTLLLFAFVTLQTYGQGLTRTSTSNNNETESKYSFYTTWLSLANFGKPETNTQHYEFQFGYQLTQKDRVGVKFATWKLFAPMGIPIWDSNFLDEETYYPGRLRETGIGCTYQRKLWKELFTTLEVLPLFTTYLDENQKKVSTGFKLYNSYHLGYHIPLFKKGILFIDPQLHVNHWMINTNVPGDFKAEEDKWNNYFLIEPNLYIGIKF